MNFQSLLVVAFTMAFFASNIHVRQKIHFHFNNAVAKTFFAATAFNVKTKPARFVAAHSGFPGVSIEVANGSKYAGVSGRITARGPANWTLVDINNFV